MLVRHHGPSDSNTVAGFPSLRPSFFESQVLHQCPLNLLDFSISNNLPATRQEKWRSAEFFFLFSSV